MIRFDQAAGLEAMFLRLRAAQPALAKLSLPQLLAPLDRLAQIWRPGGEPYRQACEMLAGTFSRRAVEAALQGLAMGLTAPVLMAELNRELGRADLLDAWAPDELSIGHVRGYPLGVVAQVLAGNVFLGGVVAIAQALLTRNAVLLKLSREDSGFTTLFAQTLADADTEGVVATAVAVTSWDSSQESLNEVVRRESDAVVVWGGAAAMEAYPPTRCRGRVIHYGPRLGVGLLLDGVDLETTLPALAWDVALWEQRACSSPRLLFVEASNAARPAEVAKRLSQALGEARSTFPVRSLTLDEKAEVMSLRELAWWTQSAEVVAPPGSMDHTVLLAADVPADIPLGFRTVLVLPVVDVNQLPKMLEPLRDYLQTATLAAPSALWPAAVDALVAAGLTQVSAAGAASARVLGLPHEGEYALRRLVKLVGIDLGIGPLAYTDRDTSGIAASLKT